MRLTRVVAAKLLAGLGITIALTAAPAAVADAANAAFISSESLTAGHGVLRQILPHIWHPTTSHRPAHTAPGPAAPAGPQSPSAPVVRPAQLQPEPYAPMPRPTGIPATSVPVAPPSPPQQPAF